MWDLSLSDIRYKPQLRLVRLISNRANICKRHDGGTQTPDNPMIGGLFLLLWASTYDFYKWRVGAEFEWIIMTANILPWLPHGVDSVSPGDVCLQWLTPDAVCYHLDELPLLRLAAEQTGAQGQRRRGLESGKCPHPSSRYRALGGAVPEAAAGERPGLADGQERGG